jgi:type II secretory pathway pseudopilin PulG
MRRAFTILELLVATALTALLLLAVFHVIGSLGRSRAALAQQTDSGAWRSDLLQTLRYDLINSTAANFHRDGITLTGHGALQRPTFSHSHEPVTIVYGLATIHGRRWLVRSQSPRDGLSNDPGWSELLCPDVDAFTIRSASSIILAPVDSKTNTAIPPVVSVSIDGPAGRIINETLVLR